MLRPLRWTAIGAAMLLVPSAAPCDQFSISVQVIAPGGAQVKTDHTYTYPARDLPGPRPALEVEAGRQLTVAWKAENTGEEIFEGAVVHFFIVRQKESGQRAVPDLGSDVEHEGALSVDFMPGEQASGKFTVTLDEAGSYLVRVETRYLAEPHGHDHFAALDLVAQERGQ